MSARSRGLFTRPPFGVLAGLIGGIVLAVALVVPAETWWSRINPTSYALQQLAEADAIYAAIDELPGSGLRFQREWGTLAEHRDADTLFFRLFQRGAAAGRVYALVGLSGYDGPLWRRVLQLAARDSSVFVLWEASCKPQYRQVRHVATPDTLQRWLKLLRTWGPGSSYARVQCFSVPPN